MIEAKDDNRRADEKKALSSHILAFFNCNHPTKARSGITKVAGTEIPQTRQRQSALVGTVAIKSFALREEKVGKV